MVSDKVMGKDDVGTVDGMLFEVGSSKLALLKAWCFCMWPFVELLAFAYRSPVWGCSANYGNILFYNFLFDDDCTFEAF
ncbi:hypothetical protein HPP92_014438 [Vanilla planifolia]|uniref:Uncharacterized protein n=1 Tax=Vanilla planifolia TaxID=51239 RepID=A0A835QG21_VANPL|nr:hypothetical protein HPP92_014438 [Vanilla planifolia]